MSGAASWRDWLRATRQTATFLGLAMIALIWGAVEFHLESERARSLASAVQSARNLTRVFEQQILQTLRANDRVMRSLQISAVSETLTHDFDRWAAEIDRTSDFTAQLSITDAAGRLIASSLGPVGEGADLSDREHYTVHRNSEDDVLFVSKPVLGRVSGKWSVQMTRRYLKPRGGFGGVIIVSLSSRKLSDLFASVDLGPDGAVALTGLDGVVSAAAVFCNELFG
jgi:hypothetical protein